MHSKFTPIERAFQLARSGQYLGLSDLRAQMKSEGYDVVQLTGPTLLKQLRRLCEQSQAELKTEETPPPP